MNAVIIQTRRPLEWHVHRSPPDQWIGHCYTLDLIREAASLDELSKNIEQCVQLFMKDLVATGQFESFLTNHGWGACNVPHQFPDGLQYQVPIELIVRLGYGRPS